MNDYCIFKKKHEKNRFFCYFDKKSGIICLRNLLAAG